MAFFGRDDWVFNTRNFSLLLSNLIPSNKQKPDNPAKDDLIPTVKQATLAAQNRMNVSLSQERGISAAAAQSRETRWVHG
jgi:hypothetical protein